MASPNAEANPTPPKIDTTRREGGDLSGLSRGSQKGRRLRHSGGFLLQDTAAAATGSTPSEETQSHKRRHSRRLLQSIRPKSSSKKRDKTRSTDHDGLGITAQPESKTHSPPSSPGRELPVEKTRSPVDESSASHDENPERPALDVEAAQIVDMALRLSQSRRMASQQLPPRLTPLADTTGVSSLRQHLLQQRKISRNGSPRPERAMAPRNSSSLRQALDSFDVTAPDGSYRYHISRSTVARVQKAKEYIELMAQYRRLLGHLPPLRHAGDNPPSTATSVKISSALQPSIGAGRQYNPLQYIRNRKVRARERQTIDGEAQGFKNLEQVTGWVDDVVNWSNTNNQAPGEAQSLPVFASAELQASDATSASASSKTSTTLARRRIDWFVEPENLIADAYWLENGDHKSLIEDRDWNRLYPLASDASLRPSPGPERQNLLSRPVTKESSDEPADSTAADSKTKPDAEQPQTSSRERRLHLRKLHTRHGSSSHVHHDFLRLRRGSTSDLSDSDVELKDPKLQGGAITKSGKDILEKQMMEMIAREERESALRNSRRDESELRRITSEKSDTLSNLPSRIHSRNGSFGDISEPEDKGGREQWYGGSVRSGRLRLDVPANTRSSLEADTAPASPDHALSRDSYVESSPLPSRGASPPRNPFSKVKHYFGDRGGRTGHIDDRIREGGVDADPQGWAADPFTSPIDRKTTSPEPGTPSRRSSRRSSADGRGHQRGSSMRMKSEEAMGMRGIFRAPARIDDVLRTGVSKIGDIIWRKESEPGDGGVMSEETVTDESEAEQRGRQRQGSRTARDASFGRKSYLSQMPAFHTPERHGSGRHTEAPSETKPSRRPSIQSALSDNRPPPRGPQTALTPPSTQPVLGPEPGQDGKTEAETKRPHPLFPPSLSTRHYSSLSRRTDTPHRSQERDHLPISRREIARLRALLLSSGIMAAEISRRANAPRVLPLAPPGPTSHALDWGEIARLSPDEQRLAERPVAPAETYSVAADVMAASVASSTRAWRDGADAFASDVSPSLHSALDTLRIRLAVDLSSEIRSASDAADEAAREATQTQRLRVKRVVDVIEKMLRRRRRRFRWLRRGMWLCVEWVLVGFMWYVWFVVMMLRVLMGIGGGAVRAVKWLLWL
ncbi:uncharacterized protein DNG_05080 [Cephalotrichum gorgonifer]|uniref:Uncharacterized protein n=1 Tax=Cephalotrichum gorgonifer TaxID=2041049 RepID=A0AAE8MXN6_9PEZI|nr:uncharacterized protein DNG_05080 [Cephalotrichum gorgonifer]